MLRSNHCCLSQGRSLLLQIIWVFGKRKKLMIYTHLRKKGETEKWRYWRVSGHEFQASTKREKVIILLILLKKRKWANHSVIVVRVVHCSKKHNIKNPHLSFSKLANQRKILHISTIIQIQRMENYLLQGKKNIAMKIKVQKVGITSRKEWTQRSHQIGIISAHSRKDQNKGKKINKIRHFIKQQKFALNFSMKWTKQWKNGHRWMYFIGRKQIKWETYHRGKIKGWWKYSKLRNRNSNKKLKIFGLA